jgi:hypothetical protein
MKELKFISLGVGVQSVTLYLMSSIGVIPRADYAIFADPGSEGKRTYAYLRWLIDWADKNNGIPIVWTGKKSIYKDLTSKKKNRFASIPLFTKDEFGNVGMLKRQCTEEYKIAEVKRAIRKIYGISPREKAPNTEIWIGITLDEIERMRIPQTNFETFVYHFCGYSSQKKYSTKKIESDFNSTRSDCISWLTKMGFPVPPKSACNFCPYQSDVQWLFLKQNEPREWKKVVKLDKTLRNSTSKGVLQQAYLHTSCVPLDEVYLKEDQTDLFINECHGGCGL